MYSYYISEKNNQVSADIKIKIKFDLYKQFLNEDQTKQCRRKQNSHSCCFLNENIRTYVFVLQ